jgi:hypothetical protein
MVLPDRYIGVKEMSYMANCSNLTTRRAMKRDRDFPRVHKREGKPNAHVKVLLSEYVQYLRGKS